MSEHHDSKKITLFPCRMLIDDSLMLKFEDNVTVIWPGMGKKPLGRPPCGWQGEYCKLGNLTILDNVL